MSSCLCPASSSMVWPPGCGTGIDLCSLTCVWTVFVFSLAASAFCSSVCAFSAFFLSTNPSFYYLIFCFISFDYGFLCLRPAKNPTSSANGYFGDREFPEKKWVNLSLDLSQQQCLFLKIKQTISFMLCII